MAEIEEIPEAHPPPQLPENTNVFRIDQLNAWTNNFEHVVGEGGQGTVFSGRISNLPNSPWENQENAVKRSPRAENRDPTLEAATIAQFNHNNIVKLIGVCTTPTHYYIVMPLLANGSLLNNYRELNWNQLVHILRGSTFALKQLHDRVPRVIFQDFKTANILLDEGFNAVLCDFGAAGLSDNPGLFYTLGFTDPHFASTGRPLPYHDIYSFGVVLLELILQCDDPVTSVHGKFIRNWVILQTERQRHVVAKKLLRRGFPRKPGCRKEDAERITQLGIRCCDPEPENRPDINGVIDELQNLRTEETQTCLGLMARLGIK